jgi:nitroreductase
MHSPTFVSQETKVPQVAGVAPPATFLLLSTPMNNPVLEALQWRYAAKSFDSQKKIAPEIWESLEESLILTPSSYGLQPWKFLIIQDSALREKLRAASWNQRQVTECSHYVVFTAKNTMDEAYVDHYMNTIAKTRSVPVESLAGFKKGILADVGSGPRSKIVKEWMARQCYIALGNFMTAAALLRVDTCPMEGLDPAKYDEILGLEQTPYRTIVACAAGYRNPQDALGTAKKVRFPAAEMLAHL